MNYGAIHVLDTANGPGCRTSLFVSGCTHHCEGCFNQETWDFGYGKPFTDEVEDYILETLRSRFVDGLTILGGEPMERVNQPTIAKLIHSVKETYNKTIWVYTGYTFEELNNNHTTRCCSPGITDYILNNIDVLVDGEFKMDLKDLRLQFRGSSNQRIINMPRSMYEGHVVLKEGFK